jgi:CBS domain-containing protein
MGRVSDILKRKSNQVISVAPDTSVIEALKIMSDKNIGSLLVMVGATYMGLITERDYARKVILREKHSDDTRVSEIMTTDLPRVSPRDAVEHCMTLMANGNVRYLPVFEGGVLVGLVSIIDVIKEMNELHKATISHLQDFISSNYA